MIGEIKLNVIAVIAAYFTGIIELVFCTNDIKLTREERISVKIDANIEIIHVTAASLGDDNTEACTL